MKEYRLVEQRLDGYGGIEEVLIAGYSNSQMALEDAIATNEKMAPQKDQLLNYYVRKV